MAKYNRKRVGTILKSKDKDKGDYIKFDPYTQESLLKAVAGMDKEKGLFLSLESQKQQLEGLNAAEAAGKISAENATKARERINKIPSFVRFEIILLEEK
jgi:hypothetical protein